MLYLFNSSNSDDTLISFINKNAELFASKSPNRKWIFYAMTCYFNKDTAKDLANSLKNILGNNFLEFHILLDKDEWLKKRIDIKEFTNSFHDKETSEKDQSSLHVTLTPINADGKLFHAKSYALVSTSSPIEDSEKPYSDILNKFQELELDFYQFDPFHGSGSLFLNDELNQGFVIITSGNFTESGFNNNIEIASVTCNHSSLCHYTEVFEKIKSQYIVSQKEIEKQKRLHAAISIISLGTFYHDWDKSFDLRFRLKFSQEERDRLKKESHEKNQERYGEYTPEERKTISLDPINIKSIFEQYPQPVPPSVWGSYSVETILGQWIPYDISQLIEEEVNQSLKVSYEMIKELTTSLQMDEYVKKLRKDVSNFLDKGIIDENSDSYSAIDSWKKKIEKISKDDSILRLLIFGYEKIQLSLDNLDSKTILQIFDRIAAFISINNANRGVTKILEDLDLENLDFNRCYQYDSSLFNKSLEGVKKLLEENRTGDLDKINKEQGFFASLKDSNQVFEGIFLELHTPNKFSYRLKNTEQKEYCLIQNLRTFKIKKQKHQEGK